MTQFDFLSAEQWSALGDVPVLVGDAVAPDWPEGPVDAVRIGVDRAGALPPVDPGQFDVLLTAAERAPGPWVSVKADALDREMARLEAAVRACPVAATTLTRVLRMGEGVAADDALTLESLAYSTLLAGGEFRRWLAKRGDVAALAGGELKLEREGDCLTVTLASPATRNAMTAAMRDALFEALANALDDPSTPAVLMRAEGDCFSTGGDLGEFGSAADLAMAHIVRSRRSAARLILALGERAAVHFHGGAIGSGLEAFAGAARRTASGNAWFQLPEVTMGLIPGAGGTVTVARAIGRHRAAWMMLTGQRVRARQALDWGLVDEIVP
ncbi:enoyl-CoA hydratase/isomerase family protein [Sphingomonas lacunae]|nr:enoyl-CoA hydratase/isomerase family protein [Sphingomonas lacunae]